MKFGPVALGDALGAIAAHTLKAGDHVIRKGGVLAAGDIDALERAGIARARAADPHRPRRPGEWPALAVPRRAVG